MYEAGNGNVALEAKAGRQLVLDDVCPEYDGAYRPWPRAVTGVASQQETDMLMMLHRVGSAAAEFP